jgi:hypothetical protein
MKVEGLLMNSRMVQGIFDDRNPQTRANWRTLTAPSTPTATPASFSRRCRLGAKRGCSRSRSISRAAARAATARPTSRRGLNSAINPDGSLRDEYLARLARILDRADDLGMVPILGIFYFGQQHKMDDGDVVVTRAVDRTVEWLLNRGYTNVLVEIANECDDPAYDPIIRPARAHELIKRVQERSNGMVQMPAGRLLVSTSFGGGKVPPDNVIAAADFILLHGNGVASSKRIREMVEQARASKAYRGQPVLFNEDDHFEFDKPDNNLLAAVRTYAGWGYFDYRMKGEGFEQGYQSVPVDWSMSSDRKRGFFKLLKDVTGG